MDIVPLSALISLPIFWLWLRHQCSPHTQAALIAAIGGPVNQQLLDVTAPIEDGEAFIQYLHEEALENAQEAEECVAAKQAPKHKHLNKCLTEEEAIEIAPHADLPFEVLAGDSHLLKLGSHYVRADPPIPVTGQLQWLKKLSQCLINFNCMLDIIMDKLFNILKIFPH